MQRLLASGSPSAPQYIDDLFASYTYTGNGSTQTITNGIDLAGNGGLVWLKRRSTVQNNFLQDTVRGITNTLISNDTSAQSVGNSLVASVSSSGFTLNSFAGGNASSETYVGWTFRKAAKFFDVVTFTTDGSGGATFSHSLGQTPGMVIVKQTGSISSWYTYHRSLTSTNYYVKLESTAAETNNGSSWITTSSSSVTISPILGASVACVAYLFAHDTAADGLIQCGSFTTDGSGNVGTVSLGWEPQYILCKKSSAVQDWYVFDVTRGWTVSGTGNGLQPNTTGIETNYFGGTDYFHPTATGFAGSGNFFGASATVVYLAIRRPNKPPTTGTQVYNAIARTGTGAAATVTGVGFAPDLVVSEVRAGTYGAVFEDRLRGLTVLVPASTSAETADSTGVTAFGMDGFSIGTDTNFGVVNTSPRTNINWCFKRATGVFDEICFSGTGANKTEAHGLGVAPELWLVKGRSGATQWVLGSSLLANAEKIVMPTPAGKVTDATAWNSTYPTASVLSLGTAAAVNTSAATYTAYLWATKAGITKVFSYTGNGSSQNIDCGFSAGARFILIVRTSAAGSVYIWDTVRGVVAGNDPYLALDTTAAEVTTDDSIDPLASGFVVNQVAASNINVTSATYIGIAYA